PDDRDDDERRDDPPDAIAAAAAAHARAAAVAGRAGRRGILRLRHHHRGEEQHREPQAFDRFHESSVGTKAPTGNRGAPERRPARPSEGRPGRYFTCTVTSAESPGLSAMS